MIVDLERFVRDEQPYWQELEAAIEGLNRDAARQMDLKAARRFHYLYERASADLGKIMTFTAEPETRRYLETLVARAYGEIHETRGRSYRFAPLHWFFVTFPQTFRRHLGAFGVVVAVTLAGAAFGVFAILFDPDAKEAIMPFPGVLADPAKRVEMEEREKEHDRLEGMKAQGAAFYMTHNTKVSILTMAMGISYGVGTVLLIFYNGVIIGAVALDYIAAGETVFLVGWLLPHGSVEIPAILLAGQAGLALGGALIGWGQRASLRQRLRVVAPDLATLICGVAIFLVWAGIVESFFSQYHEPTIPYALKIAIGCVELALVVLYLAYSGRGASTQKP